MSIDEEGKGINKNKQKEKMLIIGMEWQEQMMAFPSIGILRTGQMYDLDTDARGNGFLPWECDSVLCVTPSSLGQQSLSHSRNAGWRNHARGKPLALSPKPRHTVGALTSFLLAESLRGHIFSLWLIQISCLFPACDLAALICPLSCCWRSLLYLSQPDGSPAIDVGIPSGDVHREGGAECF